MLPVTLTALSIPTLLDKAKQYESSGALVISVSGLVYLDIDNCYIQELFPLLHSKYKQTTMPDYFGLESIGAHISVIYPEENVNISDEEIGKKYEFSIGGLYAARINTKVYYVLLVNSPSLISLRKKYGLGSELNFKGHAIQLHITIGSG